MTNGEARAQALASAQQGDFKQLKQLINKLTEGGMVFKNRPIIFNYQSVLEYLGRDNNLTEQQIKELYEQALQTDHSEL
jgi:hypothetical protein